MAQLPTAQLSHQRAALVLTLTSIIVGAARYFELALQQDWLQLGIFYGAFVLGTCLAPLLFIGEQYWLPRFTALLGLESKASYSALRNSILFLALPILGLFLVSSSRAPLGLGFLLGISLWYAWDALELLRGNQQLFGQYFGNRYRTLPELHQYLLYLYLAYTLALIAGLLFI